MQSAGSCHVAPPPGVKRLLRGELICCTPETTRRRESTRSRVLPLEKEWERERLCCSLLAGGGGEEQRPTLVFSCAINSNLLVSSRSALPVSAVLLPLETEW